MNVSIVIDESCTEPQIEIRTAIINEEIQALVNSLNTVTDSFTTLQAWKDGILTLLKPSSIMRIYTANKKVFIQTEDDEFECKYRLYEVEELFQQQGFTPFIRISNTDIINFDFVKYFDMSLAGTICVHFKNKSRAFVSRRYMPKIKAWLGIKH